MCFASFFFQSVAWHLHSLNSVICTEVFNFNKVWLIKSFPFNGLWYWWLCLRLYHQTQSNVGFLPEVTFVGGVRSVSSLCVAYGRLIAPAPFAEKASLSPPFLCQKWADSMCVSFPVPLVYFLPPIPRCLTIGSYWAVLKCASTGLSTVAFFRILLPNWGALLSYMKFSISLSISIT